MKGILNTDLAYIAGLFDGEGSFVIGKHFCKTKHNGKRGWVWEFRMVIGMSDKDGLNFIKNKFNKKRIRVSHYDKNKRKMYYLTFYSGELRKILPSLIFYLKVKRKQAKLLLNVVNLITPKSNIKNDKIIEKAYRRMKKLNHSRHTLV